MSASIAVTLWLSTSFVVAILMAVLDIARSRRRAIRRLAYAAQVSAQPCEHRPLGEVFMSADMGEMFYNCRLCRQVVRQCRHLEREKVQLSTGESVAFICLKCNADFPNEEWIKS